MATALHRPHLYLALAALSLLLPVLLPHAAAAISDKTNTALSPRAAPPPTHQVHHARSATGYSLYGVVTFADLHDACQRQNCAAGPFRRLARILYGPHIQQDGGGDIYCVVRTIEGSQPIMNLSWRAAVASGGDVCYVELGIMDDDTLRAHCPEWTCVRYCTMSRHDALELVIRAVSTPCGGATATTTTSAVASSAAPSPLNLNAALLPLLAIAFVPRPLAAAVVLAYLPRLVRADFFEELTHATCIVYPYNNNTGAVLRARPVPGLHEVCHCPPFSDPLPIYCAVHSLLGASSPSILFPWWNTWRAHLPIPAPNDSGHGVCYVELAHMNYREGYYIRCPAGDRHAVVSCTEFPEDAVRSAVWEHRVTYRDTVGPKYERYKYGSAGHPFGEYDYDADL